MVEHFIEEYAKKIALHPERIKLKTQRFEDTIEIVLCVSADDMGKFIGKGGKMIQSFKALLSGCRIKNGFNYRISIESL